MRRVIFFLISGLILTAVPAESQILDKMLKKAQKELEKKSEEEEKEVEKEVDEEVDMVSEDATNAILKSLMSGEKVEVADTYSFDAMLEMTFISYENDEKKTDGKMTSYISNDGNQFAYHWKEGEMAEKNQQGIIIYDIKRSAMIILGQDNDDKSGMVYGMDFEELQEEMKEEEEEDFSRETIEQNPYFKKTGKKKTMNGYECEEFMAKDTATVARYWIAKDVKGDYARYLKKANPAFIFHYAAWGNGFVMEADIEDRSDNQRHIMQVSDLDFNKKTTFNLNDYKLINFGTMKINKEP